MRALLIVAAAALFASPVAMASDCPKGVNVPIAAPTQAAKGVKTNAGQTAPTAVQGTGEAGTNRGNSTGKGLKNHYPH